MNGSTSSSKRTTNTSSNSNETNLNILTLNVCGLTTRQIYPEFLDLINQYDIIGLQETKLDLTNAAQFLDGYKIFCKHGKPISKVKSGGIAIAVKHNIQKFINIIDTQSKLVLWFSLSRRLTGKKNDILCGVVYIPLSNSKYCVEDPYVEIEQELKSMSEWYNDVLLLGDFNSRTDQSLDYIQVDNFLSHENHTDYLLEEYNTELLFF